MSRIGAANHFIRIQILVFRVAQVAYREGFEARARVKALNGRVNGFTGDSESRAGVPAGDVGSAAAAHRLSDSLSP